MDVLLAVDINSDEEKENGYVSNQCKPTIHQNLTSLTCISTTRASNLVNKDAKIGPN